MIEKSVIDGLVGNPSESLNVETKRWINPTELLGIEKIVKSAIALRNRNGGFFVVGFDNSTLSPDAANEPRNAKALFHVDVIQGLISKYASDPFEIEIAWGERDSRHYPVIVVPSGVKVPVAAKRELKDGSRTAIRVGAVYFRSLASNGTPSTTEARPSDWADIVEICFDNREAMWAGSSGGIWPVSISQH
jgi:predicted HTH transcriptional regulator